MIIQKPTKIYEEQPTVTQTTTRKFNYDKPEGWNKAPKKYKMGWFKRIKNGLFNVDMEPSDQKKYDALIENIRVLFFTSVATCLLFALLFNSPFATEKYRDVKYDPTYIDMGIDFLADLYDEKFNKKQVFNAPDTIRQVRRDTINQDVLIQMEVDSIMRKYREDSTRLADSLSKIPQQ